MEEKVLNGFKQEELNNADFGLVSIIMPNYNSEKYLEEAIKSVINQTYKNWELVIADDCSTDRSVEVIKQFNDERIKLLSTGKNAGAAVARNKAIDNAKGKWIAFLDSDDLWNPEKLEKQLAFMTNKNVPFSFTHYYFDRNDGNLSEFAPKKDEYSYKDILKHCYIGCSTVIYNVDTLGKVYMPVEAEKREDFGCWLSILKRGYSAVCLHELLTTNKEHQDSVSHDKIKMVKYQWNVYRKVEKISFFKSLYYMMHWAIKGFFKYKK